MRRALLLTLLSSAAACHEPSFDPVLPSDSGALDREVLALIESKVAVVRRTPTEARAHATLGLVYEANEQWDEAALCFANAITIDADQPLWHFHRAIALHEGGRMEDSITALREAGRRMEKDVAVQHRLGHVLLEMGELTEARAAFERALRAGPGLPECLAGMAGVEIACENWNEALELARSALAADPSFQFAAYSAGLALVGLGRNQEARDFLAAGMGARKRWLSDPLTQELNAYRLTVSGLMDAAASAVGKGNHAQAALLYEKILARTPADLEALNNLSACLIEMGQFDRAQQHLESTLRRTPESFAAHLNFATLALKRQDLALARAHVDLAVQFGSTVGRTHFMRGYVMILQGELNGAKQELLKTVELDARNAQYFVLLCEITAELDQVEEARGWCRKAIEIDPKLLLARENLCSLALRAGDLAEARAAVAALEELAPSSPRTIALRQQLRKREQ